MDVTQLKDEGIQKDITKEWNKLGEEGKGEELKLKVHHCLLGVEESLSHPQDYTTLKKITLTYRNHPQYQDFEAFKKEIETGNYQIHFSLEKVRNKNGSRSVYMMTFVERVDRKAIPAKLRTNIETWASMIGFDALKMDIDSVLKQLQHVPALSSQMFKTTESEK
jgi:hypothetical protein